MTAVKAKPNTNEIAPMGAAKKENTMKKISQQDAMAQIEVARAEMLKSVEIAAAPANAAVVSPSLGGSVLSMTPGASGTPLDAGARVDVTDEFGRTPLDCSRLCHGLP